jgi:hypothetical protein
LDYLIQEEEMKRFALGIILVIILAGAFACSSRSESVATRPPTTTVASAGKGEPAPTYTLAPPVAITQVPAPSINAGPSYSDAQTAVDNRMIIRNGSMQLVVDNVTDAMAKITGLVAGFSGFIVNSDLTENQGRLYGNISFRVPEARFNEALAALRTMASYVKSESTSGQDVTAEYTDLSSSLRNLQAAEAQLLKLMEQAGKVTDILAVQQELVKTRGEIEQTKGRMQYLEQSAAMSLIQATLEQSRLAIEFAASARSVKEGENVLFRPTISGGFAPYSYTWDFGDSRTSTEDNPAHAFRKAGTYTVSLKVTDDHGNTVTLKRDSYITVLAGWQAGNTASSAWNGLLGFGHFLVNLLVWLGIFSPVWIVILVVLYFTVWRRKKTAR